ncbi:hypothetical protein [Microbacterium sp. NPDC076911]|uniref:hypothetical protein n=1 Tax=Microbacterium sp. NPDC076911 TaxID=3154958 RepID=UPI0034353377
MTSERGGQGGSNRPAAALAFASIGYVALVIFGLGMTSLVLDQDVIAVPGLGQAPAVVGLLASLGAFALVLSGAVRQQHPSYWASATTTVAAYVSYLVALWLTALFTSSDIARATSAAVSIATTWFGAAIAASAFVCAWAGIAVMRTHASQPRWPWEREEREDDE